MKKIISGKIYDTEKAKFIAEWNNNLSNRDFHHIEELLYKKRTGEYFLYGSGGPMTKYAERIDSNSWSGSSQIIPLTYKDAMEWAERNMDADEYQIEFGAINEAGEDVRVMFQLPAGVADKLEKTAAMRGMSKTSLIVELISNM